MAIPPIPGQPFLPSREDAARVRAMIYIWLTISIFAFYSRRAMPLGLPPAAITISSRQQAFMPSYMSILSLAILLIVMGAAREILPM